MPDTNEKKVKFLSFLNSEKGNKTVLFIGIIAIFLIFISGFLSGNDPKEQNTSSLAGDYSTEAYIERLEEKLCRIVQNIEGAGECKVMVTLEHGIRYIYAEEEKLSENKTQDDNRLEERDEREKSYLVVDRGNGKEALIITEMQPIVKGVVIVCRGGKNALVQQQVIGAVTTALAISSTKVCVVPLS